MKRPGGFDRDAEPAEPIEPAGPIQPAGPAGSSGSSIVRRRRELFSRLTPAPSEAGVNTANITAPGDTESDTDEQPTPPPTPVAALSDDSLSHRPDARASTHAEAKADDSSAGEGELVPENSAQDLVAVPERVADVRAAQRQLRLAGRARRSKRRAEQKRFTAHLRRRRRYVLAGVLAIAGLAAFVAVGVFTPLMSVREVHIEGAEQVDLEALQSAVSQFEGVPIALVNEQELHRALEPFAQIERYALDRIPPHTLVLRIEERHSVIAIERSGTFALYDPAGVLMGESETPPEGVPLGSGNVLNPTTLEYAAAAQILRDLPADVSAMIAQVSADSPRAVVLTLASGVEVVWGSVEHTQQKAVVLRSMLTALDTASKIDVSSPDAPVFQ